MAPFFAIVINGELLSKIDNDNQVLTTNSPESAWKFITKSRADALIENVVELGIIENDAASVEFIDNLA